jgi:hypothetical protein
MACGLHADNQEYRHALRVRNTPWFCMATVDTQLCLNVTLYVHPCLVLYCHVALSEHQILFQSWDSSYRNIQNAWNCVQVKLYLICMSLNGLNIQRVTWIPWYSCVWLAVNCSKSGTSCRNFCIGCQRLSNDPQRIKFTLTSRRLVGFFWKTGR